MENNLFLFCSGGQTSVLILESVVFISLVISMLMQIHIQTKKQHDHRLNSFL